MNSAMSQYSKQACKISCISIHNEQLKGNQESHLFIVESKRI
jgi:hypothetical protein